MPHRRITRTDHDSFGLGGLAKAPTFPGTPEFGSFIEAQEAWGQRELVESQDLPVDTGDTDQEFLDLGFTFGKPHSHDPLFRPATLPKGWRKEASDHSMGSYLVDDKGRQRVHVFYKAAFYDRCANMYLLAPTTRLMRAIWGDDEPAGVELDELLTAEVACAYLDRERVEAVESLALYADGSDGQRRSATRLARIDKLIGFVSAARDA